MDLFLVNTFNPFSPLLSCWLSMTTTLINIQQRQLSTRGARFGAVNKIFANCDVCRKAKQQIHEKKRKRTTSYSREDRRKDPIKEKVMNL